MISYHNLKLHGRVGIKLMRSDKIFRTHSTVSVLACCLRHGSTALQGIPERSDPHRLQMPQQKNIFKHTRTGQFDAFQFKIVFTAGR